MEWLFWWLSPFTLWGIIGTVVMGYSYVNEHRGKELPKSETLLFIEQQNEWSKQITKYNQARENTRIQEHRLWNDEYEAAHAHFEMFQRHNPVNLVPEQHRGISNDTTVDIVGTKFGELTSEERERYITRQIRFDK